MLTFHPELKFAGRVAGIFATFEHGDHHDLDLDRCAAMHGLRVKSRANAKQAGTLKPTWMKMLLMISPAIVQVNR